MPRPREMPRCASMRSVLPPSARAPPRRAVVLLLRRAQASRSCGCTCHCFSKTLRASGRSRPRQAGCAQHLDDGDLAAELAVEARELDTGRARPSTRSDDGSRRGTIRFAVRQTGCRRARSQPRSSRAHRSPDHVPCRGSFVFSSRPHHDEARSAGGRLAVERTDVVLLHQRRDATRERRSDAQRRRSTALLTSKRTPSISKPELNFACSRNWYRDLGGAQRGTLVGMQPS